MCYMVFKLCKMQDQVDQFTNQMNPTCNFQFLSPMLLNLNPKLAKDQKYMEY